VRTLEGALVARELGSGYGRLHLDELHKMARREPSDEGIGDTFVSVPAHRQRGLVATD